MGLFAKIYFIVLPFILYVPNWTVIDLRASQWLYISILNSVFLVYILLKKTANYSYIKNPIFLSFLSLFIISLISVIWADNKVESIVKLTDLFAILSSLLIIFFFVKHKVLNIKYILSIIAVTLVIDLIGSYYQYFSVLRFSDFNFEYSNSLRGFYGNKNMTSIVFMIKLPMIIMLGELINKKFFKILVLSISFLTFYMIFLQSSRAAFLGIFLSIIFFFTMMIVRKYYYKNNIKKNLSMLLKYSLPLIVAFLFFKITVSQVGEISVENRVSSIINNSEDASSSERFRFYAAGLEYIASNPIFGCGIGNWRILSIKYDSEKMFSYVVPYFAHNDLLEIFIETGIFGFLSYLLFFIFIFKINLLNTFKSLTNDEFPPYYLLIISFIFLFLDTNLNFPLNRPDVHISILMYLAVLEMSNQKLLDVKN